MRGFTVVVPLCGAAFASTVGAMTVMIEGKAVAPGVHEDGLVSVVAGPTVNDIEGADTCNVCKGSGKCRYCHN
ncbi:hypothetical protein MJO29_000357 [Puccinia striiformis f. sp. tritici]|nr:hypothetical protein MJO29_000357 [Puccinia striiformis f. sp. tritici]